MFSKSLSLDHTLTRSYYLLTEFFFRNFISERASNTQQLLLIYTELYIFLNSWIEFPLFNRQPLEALKFKRQPSKGGKH